MDNLSEDGKRIFRELVAELARAYSLWINDNKCYYQEIRNSNLVFTTIDPPADLKHSILEKINNREPCIYQLFHTEKSLYLLRKLSVVIRKCGNLNCLPIELHSVINDITFEYVNATLDSFFELIEKKFKKHIIANEKLKIIGSERISKFKKKFTPALYQFPIVVFNLHNELILSQNIRLIPIDPVSLKEKELKRLNEISFYKCNFFLEIFIKTKCSKKLSLQLAERTRDTTYNILKLLSTHLSPQAIPLLTSNDRVLEPFHFYRYGPNRNELFNATTHNLPHFQFHSKKFWEELHITLNIPDNLITTTFQIAELISTPHFSNERVADRLERALLWYGDAVTECIPFQRIQKFVSSMEAIVNFQDGDITETFKRRIAHLHISYKGLSEDVREKARQVYDARSKIVHGSSHNETLNFCIIEFCSKTLLRAVHFLSIFGFGKTGFKKSLPKFLDDIPLNIEPKIDL
ncbi:HEPN domain-containing protein [Cronobacter sakazakii]|uniref:HEPN domain-containing protein n=1 Tax=Cronobacter sakazakii TaxID=28141 RepID=UPI0011E4A51E|nr:HEPN domain-containing protein [Cronobacter sakazakii]MDT3610560.1 HEPN domain-containing protein [Cronobacter sakazakii]TYD50118.1 hypothetical protein FNN14_11880 [Cronobacter sakazakii]